MTARPPQTARESRGIETAGRSPEELRELVSHWGAELELAPAEDIIEWAAATFGERFCVTSSMGDAVLAHLASKVVPGIDVVFLDTGYHFVETIGTRDAVAATLDVNLLTITPVQTVAEQDATYGKDLFKTDPDLCCALRKVQPLAESLAGVRRLGDRAAPGRDPQPGHRAGHRLGRQEGQGQGLPARALERRAGGALHRGERRPGQPAGLRRLPVDRLRPVHPPGRSGRGRPQRPLGRHQQDRVRDPLMSPSTAHRSTRKEAAHDRSCPGGPGPRKPRPRSAATIKALVGEVRAMRPDLRVEAAFLELSKPAFQTVVDRLVKAGHDEIVVVPLLLTEAYHATVDVPARDRRGHRPAPRLQIRATLDPRPRGVASSRCSTSGCARRSARPGSASSTPWCWPPPAPATRWPTRPSPGSPGSGAPTTSCRSPRRTPPALRRPPARRSAPSAPRAAATSRSPRCSWRPGFLPDRAAELALEAGAVAVSEPLGAHPELARTILARYAVGAVELVPV